VTGPHADSRTAADRVRTDVEHSVAVLRGCLDVAEAVAAASAVALQALRTGGKIVLIGNGGSAADAQHLAADFVGRFTRHRRPIPAMALTTDTSVLTAVGNDYGFEQVFARQVQALVRPGDVLVAISTSGASANVLAGVDAARRAGARIVALTGRDGGPLGAASDVVVRVPSDDIARVQEAHIVLGHALCRIVEDAWVSGDAGEGAVTTR
jgi:D-sedoheptulose 7-phosphate isomerase